MLKQRVITAVVLLLILCGVLAAPGVQALAIFLAITLVLGLFEWWRLTLAPAALPALPGRAGLPPWPGLAAGVVAGHVGWRRWRQWLLAGLAVLVLVRLWLDYATLGSLLWPMLAGSGPGVDPAVAATEREMTLSLLFGRLWLWAALGWLVACLYLAIARTDRLPFSLPLAVFGVLALPAAGAALLAAYDRGVVYLLSLLGLVWAADITAYFVGRAVGGPKLAPRISPGKTWSGAVGGAVGVLLLLLLLVLLTRLTGVRTLAYDLVVVWGWPLALAWGLVLAVFSIAGDLFESLLKRRAGRKDSSQLLPGHGGVLDRIDAVLPVAPLAMLLVL